MYMIFNNNGYFNSNDYILFYAESPNKWSYSESIDLF